MNGRVPDLNDDEEAEIQRQIASDPDTFEPTDEELARARPMSEALPAVAERIRRSRGRPRSSSPKQAVTLRLDPATLAKFKAAGNDWRAKMSDILDKAEV